MEQAWPLVRPWADNIGAKFLPDNTRPPMILYALFDWQGTWWYHRLTSQNLFRTFWAKFGWGHVPLIGSKPYRFRAVFMFSGLVGGVLFLPIQRFERRRDLLEPGVLVLIGLVLVGVWGAALLRGSIYIFVDNLFISGTRYAYPAIVPTVSLLASLK